MLQDGVEEEEELPEQVQHSQPYQLYSLVHMLATPCAPLQVYMYFPLRVQAHHRQMHKLERSTPFEVFVIE